MMKQRNYFDGDDHLSTKKEKKVENRETGDQAPRSTVLEPWRGLQRCGWGRGDR
jgi:hypothetical protein